MHSMQKILAVEGVRILIGRHGVYILESGRPCVRLSRCVCVQGVARMLRVLRAHHPYADFFVVVVDAFLDCACHEYKKKKNRWRKTNLLACCLRLE